MRTLKEMLTENQMYKNLTLFFDIETFQYNEDAGKESPSQYKNMTFSVAVSWIESGIVEYEIYPTFKHFFDDVSSVYTGQGQFPVITLNAHNTNKYDNHFLRFDLLYYYKHMTVENYYLTTAANDEANENTLKMKEVTKEQKQGIILEKRIKSSINLEMVFFLNGLKFQTEDNWVKTNTSMKVLGDKLFRLGVVTEDELKTDFNYTKYNQPYDMTTKKAKDYALAIFKQLDQDELLYIRNDVILLSKSVYYYSQLFKGFDYTKRTFTSNILEAYNTNDLTSFQLLNRIGQGTDRKKGKGKGKREVRYTDYQFSNQNFYDYLKSFYRGGLNFYNQFHVGKIITDGVFGMDIHSSYPFAMHNFKIPTYLKDYEEYDTPTNVVINHSDDEYSLYQLSKETFDFYILDQIDSIIIKQILVKYYSTNEFININSYTFLMLENILGITFEQIPAYSKVTFETEYFGSREQIEEFYFIKEQSKLDVKLDFNSPYDMTITDEDNDLRYSPEEVDITKVNLNGLYGIPALRPYFNLFRLNEEGDYINIENGHKNAERNIIFSIFVTSVSLWNLLNPFQYLTQEEIDENFLYCDTDSLYFKRTILHKLSDSLFTDFNLGTWELEHENMTHFYVLNHKKYAFIDPDDLNKDGTPKGIQVRAGGVPNKAFNTDMPFEKFIDTQFSHGAEIQTTKSIYNKQQTISIYPSVTTLEVGGGYRIHSNGETYHTLKERMFEQIKEHADEFTDDILYIESVLGTFSITDIFPVTHDVEKKRSLASLQIRQEQIKEIIAMGT